MIIFLICLISVDCSFVCYYRYPQPTFIIGDEGYFCIIIGSIFYQPELVETSARPHPSVPQELVELNHLVERGAFQSHEPAVAVVGIGLEAVDLHFADLFVGTSEE